MKFIPGEINIICTDIAKSRIFYCDILGFEQISEEDGAIHLQCSDNTYLLLPVAKQSADENDYCYKSEFSMDLMVEDLEHAYQYLDAHQVTFVRRWQSDAVSFIIRDPDGLVWEIIQQKPG
jgi:catechol 2,3-dioxygenase-like lactoylglutathione lyase family enzyme